MKLDVPGSQFWASSLSTSRSGSNKANDVGTQPQFGWCHLVIQRSGPLDTATGPILTVAYHHRCAHILADYAISFPPFCRNIYITIFHPPERYKSDIYNIYIYIYILIYILPTISVGLEPTWFPFPHLTETIAPLTTSPPWSWKACGQSSFDLWFWGSHHINPYPKFIERIGKEKPQTTKITQESKRSFEWAVPREIQHSWYIDSSQNGTAEHGHYGAPSSIWTLKMGGRWFSWIWP